jgi:hypothetical protein
LWWTKWYWDRFFPKYFRFRAMPWLTQLVTGLSPRRPGFDPRSVHVGFVVDKVALGQVFSEYFGFPRQFHSTGAPLPGKIKKKLIIFLFIFITRVAQ